MTKKSSSPSGESFAKKFDELEEIVQSFESEKLDVEEGLNRFEHGLKLAEELKKTLNTAEQKIVNLKKKYQIDEQE